MGCFPSVEDKSAKERSELIDKKILQDARDKENIIKLLLLGTHNARVKRIPNNNNNNNNKIFPSDRRTLFYGQIGLNPIPS